MFLEWENNSGKFENNAINDVKQISLSHVITRVKELSNWEIVFIIWTDLLSFIVYKSTKIKSDATCTTKTNTI